MSGKKVGLWAFSIVSAALVFGAGIFLSVNSRDGHYAFEWNGSELMAQPKDDEYRDLASLQVLNRVLIQLELNYVDKSRLDPAVMLPSGLDNLQKNVPELLLVFDKKVKEKPTKVTVNIQGQSKEFSLEKMDNLWEMSLRLRSIVSFVQEFLPKDAKPRELEYDIINGMLSALDPHSLILSPEVYQSMMEGNRGKFGGLGIVVRMVDGVLIVVEPVHDDVPAKRAGIEEGDRILTIDGTPTLNMSINEAVDLLKGDPDTTVHLTVMRNGWKEPHPIDVVRAEISIPSLESAALKDGIAYIKLKGFQGNSQVEVLKALTTLDKELNGIKGLVLDLRGNPGGLLDQAVLIADNFLDKGTIVTTVGANEMLQKPRVASKDMQPTYPIIVLLDSSSASASEIVAGALKNNDRALVAGDTSFGKGSVQVLYDLPDKSALKLTIGQYLTPGNQSIQSVGIVPDIRLVPMLASSDKFDLYPKPWVRREAGLGSHLDNENATKDLKPSYNFRYLSQRYALDDEELEDDSIITLEDIDKVIKSKQKANKPGDDPQVRLASEILKKIGDIHERPAMIQKIGDSAADIQSEEDAALVDQLKKLGIDWSKGTQPETMNLELAITTDSPNNTITAGDEIVIHATATNKGTQPVYRIAGRSESSLERMNDKEFIFGKINPGKSVTRDLKLKTNRALSSRVDNLNIKLYPDDGTPVPQKSEKEAEIFVTTKEQPHPAFRIHYAIIDKDGKSDKTGNGLLDDDETITMRVWVRNDGDGVARKPLIYLKNKAPEIKLVDARTETDPLQKGEVISRDFTFKTTKVGQDDIQLELHVYDKTSTHMMWERIAFKTSKNADFSDPSVKPASGTKQIKEETKLFVSPTDKSNSLVTLPEHTTVNVDAIVGDYTHIVSGPSMGWVATTVLEDFSAPENYVSTIKTISTIPVIELKEMEHLTDKDSIDIEADVTGWAPLKDYYVYTAVEVDHTFQFEKVAYEPISDNTNHIKATIPLQHGLNSIRLYVRDEKKSEAHRTILVYKK